MTPKSAPPARSGNASHIASNRARANANDGRGASWKSRLADGSFSFARSRCPFAASTDAYLCPRGRTCCVLKWKLVLAEASERSGTYLLTASGLRVARQLRQSSAAPRRRTLWCVRARTICSAPFCPEYGAERDGRCRAHTRRGGRPWRRLRAQVIARANGVCEYCCTRRPTDVHHIVPLRSGAPELTTLDQLLAVCEFCHVRLDRDGVGRHPLYGSRADAG